jgi:tRNA U38,U39,U40 pseudouridine synthase TruA
MSSLWRGIPDFYSSQQNAKTIENALFDAMVRAGAVSQDNADDPVKVRGLFPEIWFYYYYFLRLTSRARREPMRACMLRATSSRSK